MSHKRTLAILLSTSTFLLAQQPQWQQLITPTNPPRALGLVSYDHLRDRVVLIGGTYSLTTPWSGHWEYDGQTWSGHLLPYALIGRTSMSAAHDGRRAELVLFGGWSGMNGQQSDTWLHDGASWQQVSPTNSPPARLNHAMVYDEARERIVMVGGQGLFFYWLVYDDAWEWDGQNWLQRPSMPGPRTGPAIAYDSRRARTIVHGGYSITGSQAVPQTLNSDSWQWDGVAWQALPSNGPTPAIHGPSMCYDRERDRCVLVGDDPVTGIPELWEYDGAAWALDPTVPPASFNRVAYDRQRGRVVSAAPNATFTMTETFTWHAPGLAVAQPYGAGCGSPPLQTRADAAARPLLGSTLGLDIEAVPHGLAFMCFGWSNRQVQGLSLPWPMDVFGLPGCWLLQSDDAITLPCTMVGPTTARFSFAIPSHASFSGLRFFLQPWGPAPGLNPGGGVVGDAIAVTIGSF